MASKPLRPPPDHPGLTLTVYHVSRSGRRGPASRTRYRPSDGDPVPLPGRWPPCRCARCGSRARS
ncbi:hypothetical protein [Streptomyces sp. CMB-StM0423]|uniref:hypothetical protein n=1 Tax=Streptomyces sp. CMB-StM0423 TaxID=2059884 RepID=UPI000C6FCC79|nr:hypothetical protein [Streptomyces sp. CMB-StM0423]AUH42476.1 hypothetical protein CXR04_21830 [Streptomyces sp. CMB-StM0423]